ncbi:MAG: nickel insertion protein, partial [Enterocloster sp.]
ILSRTVKTIATDLGDVRKKVSSGYDVIREKYEYEDIARIARERQVSISEAVRLVKSWEK